MLKVLKQRTLSVANGGGTGVDKMVILWYIVSSCFCSSFDSPFGVFLGSKYISLVIWSPFGSFGPN